MENKFICQYCGKNTSEIEYDYLSGTDHLSCTLEAEMKTKGEYDTCVLCGVETPYKRNTHIDLRIGYIEGAGQLCSKCYNAGTDRREMTVPMNWIYDTPNDAELGAKIRQRYWELNS